MEIYVLDINGNIRTGAQSITYGSWTPDFTFATPGDLSVAYNVAPFIPQVGVYARIGNVVYVSWVIIFTPTFTTSSGSALITGLPFTSANITNYYALGINQIQNVTKAGYTAFLSQIMFNDTKIHIVGQGSGVLPVDVAAADITSGMTTNLSGSITYRTA